jgi:lysozyme
MAPTPSQGTASEAVPASISQQISTSANYYEPAVYAFSSKGGNDVPGLLTFYRDLSLTADPAAAGFIPMSAIPSRGRNPTLFAIGILPPNIQMDESQRLDRSGVISNLTGDAQTAEAEAAIARADTEEFIVPRQISSVGKGLIAKFEGNRLKAYQDSGGVLTIGIGHTGPEVTEDLVWTQEQVDAAFRADVDTFERAVANTIKVPVTQGQFDAMVSLAFNIGGGAFARSTLAKKLNAGDFGGASAEFDAFNKVRVKGKEGKVVSAWQVARRSIERQSFDRRVLDPAQPVPLAADADSSGFAGYGSQNANAFRRGLARQADLTQLDYSASQFSYRKAIKAALQDMQNTPPLRLLVNPNSFSVKSQKIASDGNWGRKGPIIEYWGDDQDKISGSGQVAAFYAIDAAPGLGRGGPGLTRHARNVSMGWQNFQSLYLLYRNNGGMYLSDVSQTDRDLLLTTVGSVYLFYDNILYIGSFDSLNVRETDMKPFTVEYDFEFTVRAAFLLDLPPDFTYGDAVAFKGGRAGLPTQSQDTSIASIVDVAASADVAAFGGSVVNANAVQATLNAAADFVLAAAGTRNP